MHRLTPVATEVRPAPLDAEERRLAVQRALYDHGIMARRWTHAHQPGITITYAHLSEVANGRAALAILAEALDWAETDITFVAGMIAVTTQRG